MRRFTRRSMLVSIVALAAGGAMLGLAGCTSAVDMQIGVDKAANTETVVATLVVAEDDFEGIIKNLCMQSDPEFDEESFAELVSQMHNGQFLVGGDYSPEYGAYVFQSDQQSTYSKVYDDTYAVYTNDILELSGGLVSDEILALIEEDEEGIFDDATCTLMYSFDFNGRTPVATSSNMVKQADGTYYCEMELNGVQLERIITGYLVDYLKIDPVYACFTDAYKTTSSISLANGSITNSAELGINTPGIIASVSVDGGDPRLARDVVNLGSAAKEGKHSLAVTLENGNSKTLTVTYDKTRPTVKLGSTSAKNGKTYTVKKNTKLTYKDTYGVKSAKLGGKSIKSGAKITKSGTLIVTDKAGNKTTVKIKVK